MRSLSSILLICVGFFTAISCSEEFTPTPFTFTKLFTGENSKTWRLNLIEITLNGEVVNRFADACLKDDKFIFHANAEHLYEAYSGRTKCFDVEPEPDLVLDTWTYSSNNATLTFIIPRVQETALPYIVREVDKDDMVVEFFFDQENTEGARIHFKVIDEE